MISSDSAALVFRARGDTAHARKEFDDLKKSADKSVSGIDSAFSGAGRGFGQLESRIQSIAGGMKSFGDGLQNLGKSLTAALTVPLAALATLGTKSAISLDDLRNKLISATGSVEAANQKFAELTRLSNDSAGVLVEFAANTFAFLKPMNLATESIDNFTKALGRIKLTDSGLDTQEFARNITQLFKQNFELADLKQLVGTFPRAAELIAEQFGIKSSDLGTLQETLQQMKEQGKLTFEGFINGFAEAVENDEALSKLTDTAGTRIAKAMERISLSLAPLGSAILDTIEPFIPPLIALIERISDSFNALSPTVKTIIVAFGALAAALGPLLIVAGSAVAAIGSLVSGLLALTGAATVGAALAALAPILLKVAAVAALAGAALAAIAGASAVLYAAWQRDFGGIQTFTLAAWERIKQIISAATEFITRTVGAAVNSLVTFWRDNYSQIEGAVKTVSENIKRIFEAFFSAVQSFWETHGERIKAVVVAVWNFIRDLIGGVIKQIGNFIKLGLQIINGDWSGAWQTFLKIVQQAVTIVVGYIKNMGALMTRALFAIVPIVAEWSIRFQVTIVKGIVAAVAAVVEAIRTLPQKIIEILPQLIPKLKEVGGQIGQALIDGIYAAFSNKPIVVPVVTQQDFIQGGISGTLDSKKIIEEQARESEARKKERDKAFQAELQARSRQNQILLERERENFKESQELWEKAFIERRKTQEEFQTESEKNIETYWQRVRQLLFEQFKRDSTGQTGTALKNIQLEYENAVKAIDRSAAKEREDVQKAIAESNKKILDEEKKAADERIKISEEVAERKIRLAQLVAEKTIIEGEERAARGELSNVELAQRAAAIRLVALEKERQAVAAIIRTEENRVGILQRLADLDNKIARQKLENEKLFLDALGKDAEAEQVIIDKLIERIEKEEELEKLRRERFADESERFTGAPEPVPEEKPDFFGTLFGNIKKGIFGEEGLDNIKTEAGIVKAVYEDLGNSLAGVFGGMISAGQQVLENFILTGKVGADAFKRLAAAVISSLAVEAGVKAIFQLAEGFVALTNPFTAWKAPLHFTAAKIYGTVAGVALAAGLTIGALGGLGGNNYNKGSSAVSGQTSGGFGSGTQRGEGGEIYTTNRDKQVIDLARNQSQTIPERPIYVQIDSKGGIPFDEFFALRVSSNGKTRDVIKKFAQ